MEGILVFRRALGDSSNVLLKEACECGFPYLRACDYVLYGCF